MMRFTKMQGAGNDFILVESKELAIPEEKLPGFISRVCSRRLSVGADGFMVVKPPERGGDLKMDFYNSDGSVGEMCGNGARCIARYGLEHGYAKGDEIAIETTAGLVTGRRVSKRLYTVRLNDPTKIELDHPVTVGERVYHCAYIELGDPAIPHAVVLDENWQSVPENELREICRSLRFAPSFPKGANVTFCCLSGENEVTARTFERGVEDFTLACGTGCGSTAAALTLMGVVSGENTKITMPGGDLFVTLDRDGVNVKNIMLTGPTNTVAQGEIMDEEL